MAWNRFFLAAGAAKMLSLPFLPARGVEETRHIPDGACILAANHSSAFDAALLTLAYAGAKRGPLHMVVAGGTGSDPGLNWFLRSAGTVPAQRLNAALGWLAASGAVGIFPEGDVNPSPALGRAEASAALLALESGAPVVPAAIIGSDSAFPAGKRLPVFGKRVRVRFGRPLLLMEKERQYASLPRDERAVLAGNVGYRIMRAIGELAGRECSE